MKEIKLSDHKKIEGADETEKAFKELLGILADLQVGNKIGVSNLLFTESSEAPNNFNFTCLATDSDAQFNRTWYTRLISSIQDDISSGISKLEENKISVIIEHYSTKNPKVTFIVPKKNTETKIYLLKDGRLKLLTKKELGKYTKEIQNRYRTYYWVLKFGTPFVTPKIFFDDSVFQGLEELPDRKLTSETWLYVAIIVLAVIIFYKIKS